MESENSLNYIADYTQYSLSVYEKTEDGLICGEVNCAFVVIE